MKMSLEKNPHTRQKNGTLGIFALVALLLFLFSGCAQDNSSASIPLLVWLIIGAAMLAGIVIAVVITLRNRKYHEVDQIDRASLRGGGRTIVLEDGAHAAVQNRVNIRIKVSNPPQGTAKQSDYAVAEELIIGRSATKCDHVVNDSAVSSVHCSILFKYDGLFIKDLGSSNGTYLNKQKVDSIAPLKNNDKLLLGRTRLTIKVIKAAP